MKRFPKGKIEGHSLKSDTVFSSCSGNSNCYNRNILLKLGWRYSLVHVHSMHKAWTAYLGFLFSFLSC